ncbi:MAG: histidine kinase [Bacteroidota bacterium]
MWRLYRTTSLTLLSLCFASLSAQYSLELDSLRSVLRTTISDTAKATISAHLSKNFILQGVHFDSARFYALRTIELAQSEQYFPALEKGYFTLAFIYSSEAKLNEGLKYYQLAYDILVQSGKNAALSTVLNNIGKIYFDQGRYDHAQQHFLDAHKLAEQYQDTSMMIAALGNIAILRNLQEEFAASRHYYLEAFRLCRQLGDPFGELSIVQNLCELYQNLANTDSALWAAERSLQLANRIGSQGGRVRALASLAKLKIKAGDYPAGLKAIKEAIPLCDTSHQASELCLLYQLDLEAHVALGHSKEARQAANLCLSLAQQSGLLANIASTHKALKEYAFANGDFETAMAHLEAYYQIKDSMLSEQRQAKMDELMTAYESEKKDRAIAELAQTTRIQELEIQQKNDWLIILLAAGLLLALGIYMIHRQRNLREIQARMEAQQRLLQTQMNPHFLFNALAAIQSLIYEHEDPEEAVFYLARFAKLMRLILENSREPFISLEQEIDTLTLYLDLQKLRFEESFSYEITLDTKIEAESLQIPPMFAQPFLENALEHGFKHREGGHIKIEFRQGSEHLHLIVEDNGVGYEQASALTKNSAHRSLALEIIRDRLKLLSNRVNQQFEFKITDLKDEDQYAKGTKVSLSLPLIQTN